MFNTATSLVIANKTVPIMFKALYKIVKDKTDVEIMIVFAEFNTGPQLIVNETKHDLMKDLLNALIIPAPIFTIKLKDTVNLPEYVNLG